MKASSSVVFAVLALSMCGYKPDAAVRRGSAVGAGPQITEHAPNETTNTPLTTVPSTHNSTPVKQVTQ